MKMDDVIVEFPGVFGRVVSRLGQCVAGARSQACASDVCGSVVMTP